MPSDNIHGISGTQFSFREDSQVFFTYIHGNCLKIFIYIVVIFQFYGFRLIKDIWQTSFKLIFFFFFFCKSDSHLHNTNAIARKCSTAPKQIFSEVTDSGKRVGAKHVL